MTVLFIKSTTRPSFRRAGRTFSYEGDLVSEGELTQAQIAAIRHEPRLTVSEVPDEAAAKLKDERAAQVDTETITEIIEVIAVLAPETKPSVKDISVVLERNVTTVQRDVAWEQYLEDAKER